MAKLDCLPAKIRVSAALYMAGKTFKDIAILLDVDPTTVKRHVKRAREHIHIPNRIVKLDAQNFARDIESLVEQGKSVSAAAEELGISRYNASHIVKLFGRHRSRTRLKDTSLFRNTEFMQSLTPRQRETVELALQGLSNKEIASKMGISAGQVGVTLSLSRRRIKAIAAQQP